VKHPNVLIYNKEGIGRHRDFYGCFDDIISIYSKRYKKMKSKQKLNQQRGDNKE